VSECSVSVQECCTTRETVGTVRVRAVKILWPNFLFDENLTMCYVKFVTEFGVIDTFETQ